MIREFAHFHPNVRRMIQYVFAKGSLLWHSNGESRKAPEITRWPLFAYDPLPGWSRGKIILIGDAAHPVRQSLFE